MKNQKYYWIHCKQIDDRHRKIYGYSPNSVFTSRRGAEIELQRRYEKAERFSGYTVPGTDTNLRYADLEYSITESESVPEWGELTETPRKMKTIKLKFHRVEPPETDLDWLTREVEVPAPFGCKIREIEPEWTSDTSFCNIIISSGFLNDIESYVGELSNAIETDFDFCGNTSIERGGNSITLSIPRDAFEW